LATKIYTRLHISGVSTKLGLRRGKAEGIVLAAYVRMCLVGVGLYILMYLTVITLITYDDE